MSQVEEHKRTPEEQADHDWKMERDRVMSGFLGNTFVTAEPATLKDVKENLSIFFNWIGRAFKRKPQSGAPSNDRGGPSPG